jgi:hypothetical protein
MLQNLKYKILPYPNKEDVKNENWN